VATDRLRGPTKAGLPDGWAVSGNRAISRGSPGYGPRRQAVQQVGMLRVHGGGPDYHVMVCQVGHVSVRKASGTGWLLGPGSGHQGGAVEVALSNMAGGRTRGWLKPFRRGLLGAF